MYTHSSYLEHTQEALQGLTTGLNQINSDQMAERIQLASSLAFKRRQPLLQSMDLASELMQSMNQFNEAMDHINEFYFGPDGAMADAIEGTDAANELAQQINNVGIAGRLGLAKSRLAATSAMTRGLSEQLSRSPINNLGMATYTWQNSDFDELVEATEEISEMVDDLARIGVQSSWHPESTTPEPDHTEHPFQDEIQETQNLLVAFLWASLSDSGYLSDDLSEEQKILVRFSLAVFVVLAVGTLVGDVLSPRSGIPAGIGSGALTTKWLSDWYDMKRRQRLPDDE